LTFDLNGFDLTKKKKRSVFEDTPRFQDYYP
jgi:hypothetical protein